MLQRSPGACDNSPAPKSPFSDRLFFPQLISPQGQIVQRYKKIHLFDAKHSGKSILESNTTLPGKELMDPVETPVGKRAYRGAS